ncbi:MAG: phosphatidylserine/phosphatidylglycerophosphate/cardiolipin synthase family protein [Candidatus Magasanikbacteria bacterium]|jgi:cardiolipin synthase
MPDQFSYQFFSTTKDTWDAMYRAVSGARESIFWEVYILEDKGDGARFIDMLCEKSIQGVNVKIILDAIGSMSFSKSVETKLKTAGVELLWYHPVSPWRGLRGWLERVFQRNHRKVLIIDEELAFIGGVNVEHASAEWNDLHLRLTGRVVRTLLRDFAKSYVKCGGAKRNVRRLFHPKLEILAEWRERVRFIFQSIGPSARYGMRNFYHEAVRTARESITFVTPYYLPDKKFFRLIAAAAKRGVKVEVLLPERSDVRIIHHIAQLYYDLSESAGVRLYFSKKMNHAKAILVDNSYGLVGSGNLTRRSFNTDEEAGVYFTEADMVRDLNTIIDSWKSESIVSGEVARARRWIKFRRWLMGWLKKYL